MNKNIDKETVRVFVGFQLLTDFSLRIFHLVNISEDVISLLLQASKQNVCACSYYAP